MTWEQIVAIFAAPFYLAILLSVVRPLERRLIRRMRAGRLKRIIFFSW